MTRHETFTAEALDQKELVLATDLDGTFLGGTAEERALFYQWIHDNRDRLGLIFVTGRDPAFISDLTKIRGVPRPDYIIADVGTTIATMRPDHTVMPIAELEKAIAISWNNANRSVEAALRGTPGLRLQKTAFRYRMSYDMDPVIFDDAVLSKIDRLGLDVLRSDNRFLDILPRGVSKGPSLLRLLEYLCVPHRSTLVAGDTLNDLSMLSLGIPAVAVGGSEAELIRHLSGAPYVYCADGAGVNGIVEAIYHHQFLTDL